MKRSWLLIATIGAVWVLSVGSPYAQETAQEKRLVILPPKQGSGEGRKVALVIGDADYSFGPLKNPVRDADAMAAALSEMGFTVEEGRNLNKRGIEDAIRKFEHDAAGADTCLFYFSGHGAQIEGANYLIPVACDIQKASDIEDEAVNVKRVLSAIRDAQASVNLVILDACRNNPFIQADKSVTKGLAEIRSPDNTLIAFATAPGCTALDNTEGPNSL